MGLSATQRFIIARIGPRSGRTISHSGRLSGPGTSGIGPWWATPSSGFTKLQLRLKIASPDWYATTSRVVNVRPSRMR